jgi:hypothetical protein
MDCPQCGAPNRAGRRFCARCAAPLALRCTTCGFRNEPDATFCGGCAAALQAAPAAGEDKPPSSERRLDAERRQLTVMFCDLVGFTGLSEHRDAEDLRDIVRAYHEVCTEVIVRFE